MSDLIKREDAIKELSKVFANCEPCDKEEASDIAVTTIKELPSADRPQGEWIWDKDGMDWNIGAWACSECHARNANLPNYKKIVPLRWSGSKFCPNCGARMFVKDINVPHNVLCKERNIR